MNTDVIEGKWKQMRGQMKEWDGTITAQVKTKLAAEKMATLTKVDVDTNKGTVYLTGNVENAQIKARATDIARQVSGVRDVVNNLKIQ